MCGCELALVGVDALLTLKEASGVTAFLGSGKTLAASSVFSSPQQVTVPLPHSGLSPTHPTLNILWPLVCWITLHHPALVNTNQLGLTKAMFSQIHRFSSRETPISSSSEASRVLTRILLERVCQARDTGFSVPFLKPTQGDLTAVSDHLLR